MNNLRKNAIPGFTSGRIVHYVPHEDEPGGILLEDDSQPRHIPAIITRAFDAISGNCNLTLMLDVTDTDDDDVKVAFHPIQNATYSPDMQRGTWHYIEPK